MRLVKPYSFLASSALAATLAVASGCSDDDNKERALGVVVYDDFPTTANGADRSEDLGLTPVVALKPAFAGGQAVQYVDFGDVNPVVPKVYVMMHDGAPVAGQYPIIDTLPDKPDYSTYWQVVEVEAPHGYKANDLKSLSGLEDAGFEMTEKLEALHCAVVNPDAYWLTADESALLNVFWATGEDQPNPYFDPEQPVGESNPIFGDESLAQEGDIVLQPVWHKRLLAFCYSEGLDARVPLVADADTGAAVIDDSALGARFDTGLLPVFSTDDGGLVVGAETVPVVNGQPGSGDDVDAEGAAPYGLVDNPVLFPLALDRFELTFTNTTPAAPDPAAVPFGPGGVLVADAEGADTDGDEAGEIDTPYLWVEGLPVGYEVGALVADLDTVPLASGFATDFIYGPFADFHQLPPIAPGASYSVVVLASPFLGVVTSVHQLPTVAGAFAGSLAALYDADGAPLATQDVDILVYDAGLSTEDGVVAPSATITDAVGTLTITHL